MYVCMYYQAPIMANPTTVLPVNQEHHHFVMTPSESHDEEDTLSQSTGLYDVKMVKSSLQPLPVASDDLDVVKSIETLSHVRLNGFTLLVGPLAATF